MMSWFESSSDHGDKDITNAVARVLKSNGYHIWIDAEQLYPGDNLKETIIDGIRNSSVVLNFISRRYLQSESCIRELECANSMNKKCIYVMLEKLNESNGMQLLLYGDSLRIDAFKFFKTSTEEYSHEICTKLMPQLEELLAKKQEKVRKAIQTTNKDIKIFVSYHQKNTGLVHSIADKLKQDKHRVWIDSDQKSTGGNLSDLIQNGIRSSSLVIFFIDNTYIKSANTKLEFFYAHNEGKVCIHVLLEKINMSDAADMALYIYGDSIRLDAYKLSSSNIDAYSNKIYESLKFKEKDNEEFQQKLRDELFVERKDLLNAISNKKTIILHGLPGVGKTSVAIEHAFRKIDDKTIKKVYWFDADSAYKISDALFKYGSQLNNYSTTDERSDLIDKFIEFIKPANDVLLIFDNVERLDDLTKTLNIYVFNCHVLITTANEDVSIRNVFKVNVPLFSSNEAKEYIHKRLNHFDRKQIELILNRFSSNDEYLPYRLILATHLLADDPTIDITALLKKSKPISFIDQLVALLSQRNKATVEVLRSLIFLDLDFISGDILKKITPQGDFKQIVQNLLDKDMCRIVNPNTPNFGIRMHRLLQQDLKSYFEKDRNRFKESLINTVKFFNSIFPEIDTAQSEDRTHVEDRIAQYYSHIKNIEQNQGAECLKIEQGELFYKLSLYTNLVLADFDASLNYAQMALQQIKGVVDAKKAKYLNNMAALYSKQGDYKKGLEYYQQVYDLLIKLYKTKDHEHISSVLVNIGLMHDGLGDHQLALKYSLDALDRQKRLYSGDNVLVARTLSSISSFHSKQGDTNKAIEFANLALEMQRRLFKGDHPDIASSYGNIALQFLALGNEAKALEYSMQGLEMRLRLFKDDQPDIVTSFNSIGLVYSRMGDNTNALDYSMKALEMTRRLFKHDHPSIANSLNNIASTYSALGDDAKALEYSMQALDMTQRLFKGDHTAVADTLSHIAMINSKLGDNTRALQFAIKALEIKKRMFNGDHLSIADSLSRASLIFSKLGDLNKSILYSMQAVEMRQRLYKSDHPDMANSLFDLGASYFQLGDQARALKYHLNALGMRQRLFKDDHPSIASSYYNIGSIYQKLGNKEQSKQYFIRFMKTKNQSSDENNTELTESLDFYLLELDILKQSNNDKKSMVSCYQNIATSYLKSKNHEKAIEFLTAGLSLLKECFENAPSIEITFCKNLASAYAAKSDKEKALLFHSRVLEVEKRLYGAESVEITDTLNMIGNTYSDLQDESKALLFYENARTIRENCLLSKVAPSALKETRLFLFEKVLICRLSNEGSKHILMEPKLLPCGNTVCAVCLKDLSNKYEAFWKEHQFTETQCVLSHCCKIHDLNKYFNPIKNAYITDLFNHNIARTRRDVSVRHRTVFEEIDKKFNLDELRDKFNIHFRFMEEDLEIRVKSLKVRLEELHKDAKNRANREERALKKNCNAKTIRKLEMFYKTYRKPIHNLAIRAHNIGTFEYNKHTEHPLLLESSVLVAKSYEKSDQYDMAIEFYEKALDMQNKLNPHDESENAEILMKLGLLHSKSHNEVKALKYKLDALEVLKRTYKGDTIQLAEYFSSVAKSYLILEQYHKTLDYSNQSLIILKRLNAFESIIEYDVFDLICESYSRLGKVNKSERYKEYTEKFRGIEDKSMLLIDDHTLYIRKLPRIKKSTICRHELIGCLSKLNNDTVNVLSIIVFPNPDFISGDILKKITPQGDFKQIVQNLLDEDMCRIVNPNTPHFGIRIDQRFQEDLKKHFKKDPTSFDQSLKYIVEVLNSMFPEMNELSSEELNSVDNRVREYYNHIKNIEQNQGVECLKIEQGELFYKLSLYTNLVLADFDASLNYAQMALQQTERVVDARKVKYLNNMAGLYSKQGDYSKGLEYYKRVYDLLIKLYKTKDHEHITSVLVNIGLMHDGIGDYQLALKYSLDALDRQKRLYSGDNVLVARTLSSISSFHSKQGDTNKAIEFANLALEMQRRLFKGDHPDIASSYGNIALQFLALGDNQKALVHLLKALEIRQRLYNANHPDIATSFTNIGLLYSRMGIEAKALEYFKKTLDMRERLCEGDNAETASSMNDIAGSFKRIGDGAKALEYSIKALEMRQLLFKGDHPTVAESLNNVAETYLGLGEQVKAFEYSIKALGMAKRLFKDDHPDIIISMNNVASSYLLLGEKAEALEYSMNAFEMTQRLFKGDHPLIVTSLNNIASSYSALGSDAKAKKYLKTALDMKKRLYSGTKSKSCNIS